jgi:hypothetical protein
MLGGLHAQEVLTAQKLRPCTGTLDRLTQPMTPQATLQQGCVLATSWVLCTQSGHQPGAPSAISIQSHKERPRERQTLPARACPPGLSQVLECSKSRSSQTAPGKQPLSPGTLLEKTVRIYPRAWPCTHTGMLTVIYGELLQQTDSQGSWSQSRSFQV